MNKLYKIFLTINATSWVIVIYGIKEEWTIAHLPTWVFSILLLLAPIFMSGISVFLTLFLGKDFVENCDEVEEANSTFLPVYLCYFFVGLGIDKCHHLIFIYLIIFIFTYVAQASYFNPIFLLFGYHFYKVKTTTGTKIFLIVRENIRRVSEVNLFNLRRINNNTFISWRNRNESINS